VWLLHPLPQRLSQPLREPGGDRLYDPGRVRRVHCDRRQVLLELDAIADKYGSVDKAYEAGSVVEPTSVAYNGMFHARVDSSRARTLPFLARAQSAWPQLRSHVPPAPAWSSRSRCRPTGANSPRNWARTMPMTPSRFRQPGRHGTDQGRGADFMVEAAGAPLKTIPEMEKCLAISGKIVQIGRAAERVPMYLETLQVRRGQIFGPRATAAMRSFRASSG